MTDQQAEAAHRASERVKSLFQKAKAQLKTGAGLAAAALELHLHQGEGAVLPSQLEMPPCELLPYETLEVLVNHENIWANVHGRHAERICFELDDEALWEPFVKSGKFEPAPFVPFYLPEKLAPKLAPERLANLRTTLLSTLKSEFGEWRNTRGLPVRYNHHIERVLNEGLRLMEAADCSSAPSTRRHVDRWRGKLMAHVQPGRQFVGRAFSFSVASPEEVVPYLLRNHKYHENLVKDARFGLAVQCFGHHCAVVSTRVYVCVIAPKRDPVTFGALRKESTLANVKATADATVKIAKEAFKNDDL